MLIVQNRLVAPTSFGERIEQGFGQQSNLAENPGFVSFKLLKATEAPGLSENEVLYIAQTTWQTRQDYETWHSSDAFSRAHAGQGGGQSPLRATLEIFEISVEK